MRTAVLLGRTREIGTPRRRRAAGPDELVARLDLRGEELVLEVPGRDADSLHELHDLLRFGDVPRERLLAGDPLQLALALLDRGDDLLDVLQTRVVRPRQPDRIDVGIDHHVGNRLVGLRVADVQLARELCGGRSVLRVRAPDAANIAVPNGGPSTQMELRVESAPDEPHPETLPAHCLSALFMRS